MHWLAKIAGWGQFGLNALTQISSGSMPHGAVGWTSMAASLITAIAVHAAGSTDGVK